MLDTLSTQVVFLSRHTSGSGPRRVKNRIHMKSHHSLKVALAILALAGASSLTAGTASKQKDLVATASQAGSFNTLVAAVKAAGLSETLQGEGPFTIFAPTDAAFAKLPAGTVEDLLKPQNKAKLVAVLTYHVVPGKIMAADVTTSKPATVNGQPLSIAVMDGGVTVDGARVIKADVVASNGVIHVIDSVVLPK